jgi:hypothetical protein
MAFEQNPYAIKVTMVADASAASGTSTSVALQTQYTFVKIASASITGANESGSVATAVTAITDRPLGILQNQPKAWFNASSALEGVSEAEVTVSGVTKVVAGGTISVGSVIGTSATGTAVAIVPGTATTQYILGTALTAGVAGDIITIAVACHNSARAA